MKRYAGDVDASAAGQVVLLWQIDLGHVEIPKSVKASRIIENIELFDFGLTAEEIAAIDALDKGQRGRPDPEQVNSRMFNLQDRGLKLRQTLPENCGISPESL